jgi:hypothetical protein
MIIPNRPWVVGEHCGGVGVVSLSTGLSTLPLCLVANPCQSSGLLALALSVWRVRHTLTRTSVGRPHLTPMLDPWPVGCRLDCAV